MLPSPRLTEVTGTIAGVTNEGDGWVVWVIMVVALIFEFVNGFHDTANAIATSIATRAVTPRGGLLLAAVANFTGALLSTRVALTVGTGLVRQEYIVLPILLAGLLGGLCWNLITWYLALPTSSSHSLVGGIAGAAVVAAGFASLNTGGLIKIILSLFISPLIGLLIGYLFYLAISRFFPASSRRHDQFRHLQLVSASLIALSHGSNDAQKMMGIITMALFGAELLPVIGIPPAIKLICAAALTLGTATGGWRIIKTLGTRITKLRPAQGFAAETGSFLTISIATYLGAPVSTTQVVATSIMGVGATRGRNEVTWPLAGEIGLAWLVTLPLSALLSAAFYLFFRLINLC